MTIIPRPHEPIPYNYLQSPGRYKFHPWLAGGPECFYTKDNDSRNTLEIVARHQSLSLQIIIIMEFIYRG